MWEKAEAMNRRIQEVLGESFSIWDMLCFSAVALVNASNTMAELKEPTKQIVGLLIDGNLILKDSLRDGVSPFKNQSKPS